MIYKWIYKTRNEFDNIVLTSDGVYLTGLYFENSKEKHKYNTVVKELEIFKETSKWLDIYFSGKEPSFTPKYKLENLTPFREDVINIMKDIPFGKTICYKDISNIIEKKRNIKKMSSQAVGGAVHYNPVCIIIPCHRVVGKNKDLTGYGGGINNKISLLKNEGIDINEFFYKKR